MVVQSRARLKHASCFKRASDGRKHASDVLQTGCRLTFVCMSGVISGILHSPGWSEALCDFALAALQLVIRPDVIQESLEPRAHPVSGAAAG